MGSFVAFYNTTMCGFSAPNTTTSRFSTIRPLHYFAPNKARFSLVFTTFLLAMALHASSSTQSAPFSILKIRSTSPLQHPDQKSVYQCNQPVRANNLRPIIWAASKIDIAVVTEIVCGFCSLERYATLKLAFVGNLVSRKWISQRHVEFANGC